MAADGGIYAEIIVKLISTVLDHILGPSSRLVYFETNHVFALLGNQQVNTHKVGIQNLGRKVDVVQVIHNWPPGSFNYDVSPLRACRDLGMQGRVAFEISYIRPGETILVTYIYGTPPAAPLVHSISTANSEAENIEFPLASRRYPKWVIVAVAVSAIVGAVVLARYIVQAIKMLWHALSPFL